jgi:hypothetical protein
LDFGGFLQVFVRFTRDFDCLLMVAAKVKAIKAIELCVPLFDICTNSFFYIFRRKYSCGCSAKSI